jgi:hypothetical protein
MDNSRAITAPYSHDSGDVTWCTVTPIRIWYDDRSATWILTAYDHVEEMERDFDLFSFHGDEAQ